MSNIEQNLAYILSSRYGEDVRQAIHDSIHDCYEDGKAGAVDLIAREQIANLVASNPSENIKDSELVDIRVGADGVTYTSAGEAVRTVDEYTFNALKSLAGGYEYEFSDQISSSSYIDFDIIRAYILKGCTVEVTISVPEEKKSSNLAFNVSFYDFEEEAYKQTTSIYFGDAATQNVKIVAQDNYKSMNIYSNAFGYPFYFTMNVKIYSTNGEDQLIDDGEIVTLEGNITAGSANRESNLKRGGETYVPAKTTYYLTFEESGYTSEAVEGASLVYGSFDYDETSNRNIYMNRNRYKDVPLVATARVPMKVFNIYTSVYNGTFKTEIGRIPFNNMSILGDSFAAYEGYLEPNDNNPYWPTGGSDVTDYTDTWMFRFSQATAVKIEQNNSWAGSTIAYNGTGDGKTNSFIERAKNLRNADVILIEGGTNDEWLSISPGEYKYSNWTDTDLQTFRPALAYLLNYIRNRHAGSQIIFMLNDQGIVNLKESIETICDYYEVPILYLGNILPSGGHPDKHACEAISGKLAYTLMKMDTILKV